MRKNRVTLLALASSLAAACAAHAVEGTRSYDATGQVAAPTSRRTIEAPLAQALQGVQGGRIAVQVALNLPAGSSEPASSGEGTEYAGQWQDGTIDGRALSDSDMRTLSVQQQAANAQRRAARQALRADSLTRWARAHGWQQQAGVKDALLTGRSSVVLQLTPAQVRRLAASADPMVAGIGLAEQAKDDSLDSAMLATSISTSALPNSATRGKGIGIYQTETGCADPSKISNYTRLAGSDSEHALNVGSIVRTVSPESYLYCRSPVTLPLSSDLDGVNGHPAIKILTRSNSSGDSTEYSSVDRDWDNYAYDNHLAIFTSGGNTGDDSGNVCSPGKGFNLITVGNYDDDDMTMRSSSPWRDPETHNEKPELTAPGTNIDAGGVTMSGTSQSTPHAAAFAADMMSDLAVLVDRPYLVKARMLAGATDVIRGDSDQLGVGGIDFKSAHFHGKWAYWSGSNSDFAKFDAADGTTDGNIERKIAITGKWKKVRVAIAWMNRGSYTYAHAGESHAIGMDLDLKVYDPNGQYVGGSTSYDNPYEVLNFTPAMEGTYTVRISRPHNADTSSDLRVGMYANFYK